MSSSSTGIAPTVSIVIPAYNEEATIRACVTAALAQTVPAHEVIVVDNRSTDRTAAIVAELQAANPDAPLRVIPQFAEQGLVPTRNLGLDSATGDVIGRIDADSVLEPTWVEEVQKAFLDPAVAAATGPVLYYDMPLRRFGLRADDTLRRAMLRLAREYHFVFGSNMALRATAWQAIRGEVCRDEEDLFHEDIDISVHLYDAGLKAVYVPTMVAGMSARRVDDSPRDYVSYVGRFDRTYTHHDVRNRALRAPAWVFLAVYPIAKGIRWGQNELVARLSGSSAVSPE
ncbi:glycosyltransferase [Microcella frigidaquae]|uniref:Glycosyltransferase involved in cell wall biosynthesis n=1 Tax=Microcella frigidaquae TaxID=424758 RepID=A0A840X436_9MICO|nr:glycosyltransferase involved in cell wall biosynthesis [Microcella frigidaquae]NHN45038.1 glycosyltransferase family 2 protein [Microcella frigidaquae]